MTVNNWGSPPLKDDFHCTLARVSSQTISILTGAFGFPVCIMIYAHITCHTINFNVLSFVYFVKVVTIMNFIILTLGYHIHNHGYFSKQIPYFKMINSKIILIHNCLTDTNCKIIYCISVYNFHHLIGYSSIFIFQFNQRLRICNYNG